MRERDEGRGCLPMALAVIILSGVLLGCLGLYNLANSEAVAGAVTEATLQAWGVCADCSFRGRCVVVHSCL